MKIQTQILKEIVAINIFVLIFCQTCIYAQPTNEERILIELQTHYNLCLVGKKIEPDTLMLSSLLSTIDSNFNDSINIEDSLRMFISVKDWDNVSSELIALNHTYWKPNAFDCNLDSKSKASISKPVYFEKNKAAVIGYQLSSKSTQSIIFLKSASNHWEVIGDVTCGVYFKVFNKLKN